MATSIKLPAIIGHRGACAYAPENTLASFRKAAELGAQWVEMDVQLTQDGELVIFHDATLERTSNGAGLVCDTPYPTIARLDAGSWFSPYFCDERIPSLSKALSRCLELGLGVNLELKAPSGMEESLVKKTLAVLGEFSSVPLLLSSFSMPALQCLRQENTYFPLGWNLETWSPDVLETASNLQLYSVHGPAEKMEEERIQALHAQGQKVLAFTVNETALAAQLFSMGVDALFTDVPDKLLQA